MQDTIENSTDEKPMENRLRFKKEVCETHNSRMSRKDKAKFRAWVLKVAKDMGYDANVENNFFTKNIVIGDPKKAEIVVGAHYDTPPAMSPFIIKHQILTLGLAYPIALMWSLKGLMKLTSDILPATIAYPVLQNIGIGAQLINFGMFSYMLGFLGNPNQYNYDDNSSGVISAMQLMENYKDLPQDERDKVVYVLFDNEEKMLWGSLSYSYKHKKETRKQTIINMDCVGVAETMNLLYVGKNAPEITKELQDEILKNTTLNPAIKRTTLFSMSDHLSFAGAKERVCLLAKDPSLYSLVSHIHSKKDREIKDENVTQVVGTVKNIIDNRLYRNKKPLSLRADAVMEVAETLSR